MGDDARAQAFETWARQHGAQVRRAALLLTADRHDADDLAQDVMVKLFAKWDHVEQMENPAAYARRILINRHLSLGRRLARFRSRQHLLSTEASGEMDAQVLAIESAGLHRALLELGDRQRAVVVLRYYYDLPDAEIAELLGGSVATVRSQAHRALAKLRQSVHVRGS